jgi:hypothetical protein
MYLYSLQIKGDSQKKKNLDNEIRLVRSHHYKGNYIDLACGHTPSILLLLLLLLLLLAASVV